MEDESFEATFVEIRFLSLMGDALVGLIWILEVSRIESPSSEAFVFFKRELRLVPFESVLEDI